MVKRSMDEFKIALKMQLEFIENSCSLYDEGFKNEAIRIATAVSIILIDTPNQKSILSHLLQNVSEHGLVSRQPVCR